MKYQNKSKVLVTDGTRPKINNVEQIQMGEPMRTEPLRILSMKADLDKLTSDPNKLVNESRNEVARILRVFLREHQISNLRFLNAIRVWALKRTGGDSKSKHANDSGNFIKAVTKSKISFERLITTMEILKPLSWSITIGVRWDARPEQKIRFNYIDDPVLYKTITGEDPGPYLVPIHDDEDELSKPVTDPQ